MLQTRLIPTLTQAYGMNAFAQALTHTGALNCEGRDPVDAFFEDNTWQNCSGLRKLISSRNPQNAVARRLHSYQEQWTTGPMPLNLWGGLYLYAQGGELYEEDAQVLIDEAKKAQEKNKGDVNHVDALVIDWGLLEAHLITGGFEAQGETLPEIKKNIVPEQRWLELLTLEVSSDRLNEREGTADAWLSPEMREIRRLRECPSRDGRIKREQEPIYEVMSLAIREGCLKLLHDEYAEEISSGLLIGINRFARKRTLNPGHEFSKLRLIGHNIGREVLVMRRLAAEIHLGKEAALEKFSVGDIEAFQRYASVLLKEVPDAHNMAPIVTGQAIRGVGVIAKIESLALGWLEAYHAAKEKLASVPEAGDIAKTIAAATFKARKPDKAAQVLINKWQIAYDAADQISQNTVGTIPLKEIAHDSYARKTPELHAQRLAWLRLIGLDPRQATEVKRISTSSKQNETPVLTQLSPHPTTSGRKFLDQALQKSMLEQVLTRLGEQDEELAQQLEELLDEIAKTVESLEDAQRRVAGLEASYISESMNDLSYPSDKSLVKTGETHQFIGHLRRTWHLSQRTLIQNAPYFPTGAEILAWLEQNKQALSKLAEPAERFSYPMLIEAFLQLGKLDWPLEQALSWAAAQEYRYWEAQRPEIREALPPSKSFERLLADAA